MQQENKNYTRVIIIGGSSNVGKSTVAQTLAQNLGWSNLSTDSLARHPGRPWKGIGKTVPEHVVEHYATLSVDDLITDVLRHYRRIWPVIETIITRYATDLSYDCLVIEGSALWPETVATHEIANTNAIWFTADDELFQKRIYQSSNYEDVSNEDQYLIDQFLNRTIQYDQKMMSVVRRLELKSLHVEEYFSPDDLSVMCQEILLK